jgi:hypothetical protein
MTQETGMTVTQAQDQLSLSQVAARVNLVHNILEKVMKQGTHFGTVQGCGDKKTLFKPGADLLAMTFRLVPRFKVDTADLGNGHVEYSVTCSMHNSAGELLGEGVGSCSTMEKKYRYRKDSKGNKIENEDIADVRNTVLKMAKKRAQVDATLTVTGAADLFTQDLVEPDDELDQKPPVKMPVKKEAPTSAQEQAQAQDRPAGDTISEAQGKRLFALSHKASVTVEALRDYLHSLGIEHTRDIKKSEYEEICKWVEAGGQLAE